MRRHDTKLAFFGALAKAILNPGQNKLMLEYPATHEEKGTQYVPVCADVLSRSRGRSYWRRSY